MALTLAGCFGPALPLLAFRTSAKAAMMLRVRVLQLATDLGGRFLGSISFICFWKEGRVAQYWQREARKLALDRQDSALMLQIFCSPRDGPCL